MKVSRDFLPFSPRVPPWTFFFERKFLYHSHLYYCSMGFLVFPKQEEVLFWFHINVLMLYLLLQTRFLLRKKYWIGLPRPHPASGHLPLRGEGITNRFFSPPRRGRCHEVTEGVWSGWILLLNLMTFYQKSIYYI